MDGLRVRISYYETLAELCEELWLAFIENCELTKFLEVYAIKILVNDQITKILMIFLDPNSKNLCLTKMDLLERCTYDIWYIW